MDASDSRFCYCSRANHIYINKPATYENNTCLSASALFSALYLHKKVSLPMIQISPPRVDSMSALSLPIPRQRRLPLLLLMSVTELAIKLLLVLPVVRQEPWRFMESNSIRLLPVLKTKDSCSDSSVCTTPNAMVDSCLTGTLNTSCPGFSPWP